VTIVIRRPIGALVGLAAASLLLSACSSGPSQVGQAVIVGNTTVSVNTVQQEVDNLLASQSAVQQAQKQGQLNQVSLAVVTSHVRHQLITQVAGQQGLTVSDQQIDQLITQAGGPDKAASSLLTAPANVRDQVRDVLLQVALARKYADHLSVTFGYVVAADRSHAISDAQQVAANPAALSGLVQQANAAAQAQGGQGAGGQLTTNFSVASYLQGVAQNAAQAQSSGQQAPTENDGPLFGAPAGTVLAFQPDPTNTSGWVVALIKSRDTTTKTPQTGGLASQSTDTQTLEQVGIALLHSQTTQVAVRVSPRYGVWDPVGVQAVQSSDQTLGVEFPVRRQPSP
jgi:hypothetical protein